MAMTSHKTHSANKIGSNYNKFWIFLLLLSTSLSGLRVMQTRKDAKALTALFGRYYTLWITCLPIFRQSKLELMLTHLPFQAIIRRVYAPPTLSSSSTMASLIKHQSTVLR